MDIEEQIEEQKTKRERQVDIELEKSRWSNRRRMAWMCLMSMIVLTYVILFTNFVSIERLGVLGDVITWFYLCCASVIGAYMGVTTWAAMKK
jgi:hypothetical protein